MGKHIHSSIVWHNVYNMLCYNIKYIKQLKITRSSIEQTESLLDLIGILMTEAHKYSLKYSILVDYEGVSRLSNKPSGFIDIPKSISTGAYASGLICYTEYTLGKDTYYNRIINEAYEHILKQNKECEQEYKMSEHILSKVLSYKEKLHKVGRLSRDEISDIYNGRINLISLPNWLKPVISASIMIIKRSLYRDDSGEYLTLGFDNYSQLHLIYEGFVREFFALYLLNVKNASVTRPVYSGNYGRNLRLDMLVHYNNIDLVIDTKWYTHKPTGESNLFQMFKYIVETASRNMDTTQGGLPVNHTVGLILYADASDWKLSRKVDEQNMLYTKTLICEDSLNLNQPFDKVKEDLIRIFEQTLNAATIQHDNEVQRLGQFRQ